MQKPTDFLHPLTNIYNLIQLHLIQQQYPEKLGD